jgi:hypothetical protein
MKQEPHDDGADRRQHRRFRVKEGALAFLGQVPGTIIDISEGGMSIHYVVFEREPSNTMQLDIFFAENEFFLPDLPVQLVSDVDASEEPLFSATKVKRLGIRFGELNSEQRSQLKYFILNNTVSTA